MGKGKRDTVYSWDEVNSHNDSKSCWLVIRDDVHDVTKFLDEHPGGKEFLLDCTGEDATTEFDEFGHSPEANGMLEQYVIGVIEGSEKAKKVGGLKKSSGNAVVPRKGTEGEDEPVSGTKVLKATPASSSAAGASGGSGTTRYPRSPSNKMPTTEKRDMGSSGASAFAPAAAVATALVAIGLVRGRTAPGGFFGAIKDTVTANTATKIGTAAAVAFAVLSIARA